MSKAQELLDTLKEEDDKEKDGEKKPPFPPKKDGDKEGDDKGKKKKDGEEEEEEEGASEAVDIQSVIKALIDTSFGGSNEEQMKAVQLLKGLATSDDPMSNKFMKALDKFTSALDVKDFS